MARLWTRPRTPTAADLLVPGRRPRPTLKIDWANTLSTGMFCYVLTGERGNSAEDIAGNLAFDMGPNAVKRDAPNHTFIERTSGATASRSTVPALGTTFTLACRIMPTASLALNAYFCGLDGRLSVGMTGGSDGGKYKYYMSGATSSNFTATANKSNLYVLTRDSSNLVTQYIDGILSQSVTKTTSLIPARLALGSHAADGGYGGVSNRAIEWVSIWPNRCLTAQEVFKLSLDEFQLLKSANDAPFLFSVAAGGDTDVSAGTAALTLTAYPATVNAETNVQADKSAHIIIAWRADINAGINVAADAAALSITTQPATVNAETYVSSSVASLTLATSAATVQVGADVNVSAGTAALTLTELVATVNAAKDIVVNVAALTLSTPAATISLGVDVQATTSALTLTVHAATIAVTGATNVAAATAALTINTYDASVLSGAVHMRTQIRDAVATALAGLTQTGSRVFLSRSLPLGAETPAILIYTNNETAEYDLGEMICIPRRLITLTVEGYHHGDDDDLLDQIALEVETALFSDPTLGGLAEGISNTEQTLSRESEGAKNTGVITMEFGVAYRAADGAPATAVN